MTFQHMGKIRSSALLAYVTGVMWSIVFVGGLSAQPSIISAVEEEYSVVSSDGSPYHWRDSRECGVSCSYVLLRLMGKTPQY